MSEGQVRWGFLTLPVMKEAGGRGKEWGGGKGEQGGRRGKGENREVGRGS